MPASDINPTAAVPDSILVRQPEEGFENLPDTPGGPRPSASYSVHIAQSVEEVEEVEKLSPLWETWPHNLDTDLDYYLHSLKSDPTTSPYVISVFQDGVPQAMLVGRVQKRKLSAMVSFVRLPGPKVRVLEIVAGGRLGRPSAHIDKLLARELFHALQGGAADVLCLLRLPLGSELYREVQQFPGLLVRARVPHVFSYSVLSLAAPKGRRPAAFSRKNGHEFRRKTRILERAFPDQVRFKCFANFSELDAGVGVAAGVALTTWQSYLGCGLSRTAQTEEDFRFCARQGWLRIFVLYVGESPCAFLLGHLYRDTFYCQYAGYDPKFARFSVGSLLTSWTLEHLSAAGVQQVDLGEGDQEHNRRLGCQMCEEGTVHVYAQTARGFCASVFFASTQMVRVGGRKAVTGLRLHWLLAMWRQALTSWRRYRTPASPLSAPQHAPDALDAPDDSRSPAIDLNLKDPHPQLAREA